MMEKYRNQIIIYVVVAVVIIATLVYFWPSTADVLHTEDDQGAVTFINPFNKDEVDVVFENESAILSGLGYNHLILQHATSASGARFTNEDVGLELWNRGEEVIISRAGKEIFSGNTTGETDAERLDGTWVWQATTLNGTVTEPKSPGAFSITFDIDTATIQGKTDCNGFGGSYKAGANNSLIFGALNSTLMYCEGSEEQVFVSALPEVDSYYFTGSGALVLEFRKKAGTMLFVK